MNLTLAVLGALASIIAVYEALAPPDRRLHRLALDLLGLRRTRPTIQVLISQHEMERIPAGTFVMGTDPRFATSQRAFSDEFPQRTVMISHDLFVGKRLVTQQLWEAIMGTDRRTRYEAHRGANKPVVGISWYDAVQFCNEMSAHAGLTPAYSFSHPLSAEPEVAWNLNSDGYRLPTEAEWEFFTRAKTTSPYWCGYSYDELLVVEWTGDNTSTLRDVGLKRENPWGLHDTHGLVGEWCWDWYADYKAGDVTDPIGPRSGSGKVWRGGKWIWKNRPEYYRSADRDQMLPVNNDTAVGFRIVRTAHGPELNRQ